MLFLLKEKRWSPYLVGFGIAAVGVASYYFFNHSLGASSAFERCALVLYALFSPVVLKGYALIKPPFINWHVAFIIGVFFGSMIAANISGYRPEKIPSVWKDAWGNSWHGRILGAFVGGFILMLGARIARGCTSGHAISGGMQSATAGWLFMIALFASGILTAHILYKRGHS